MHNKGFSKLSGEKPLLSILMTCFNKQEYIATSIKSVLASSYTSFGLIIVDDGSSDKTVDIVRSYCTMKGLKFL